MKHYFDPYQHRLPVAGGDDDSVFATPCQRDARDTIDTMLDNAVRLDADVDRLAKEGKIQGPKPGVPLPKDSLWYRWKICFEQSTAYHTKIRGTDGEGINSVNCGQVRQVSLSLMDRHAAFRKELNAAAPGKVDPGKEPPPEPPPIIDGKDVLGPLVLGGQALIAFVALATVIPKILGGSRDK